MNSLHNTTIWCYDMGNKICYLCSHMTPDCYRSNTLCYSQWHLTHDMSYAKMLSRWYVTCLQLWHTMCISIGVQQGCCQSVTASGWCTDTTGQSVALKVNGSLYGRNAAECSYVSWSIAEALEVPSNTRSHSWWVASMNYLLWNKGTLWISLTN